MSFNEIEQLIYRFETMSPENLLNDLSSGNASAHELKFINKIMNDYVITDPVMNVLIHYVLLQTNMSLPNKYLETLASHLASKNVKTAREAMEFIRKNHKKTKDQQEIKRHELTKSASNRRLKKPFTIYEYKYIEKLFDQYGMDFSVSREIIFYGRKVNNGLLVYWFLDAVADYIYRHNGKTAQGTKELLEKFHQKFVVNFGEE